tara:strand:+ start:3559 stop:4692 length:1134 start_codon:yes stop_codon:yes gene_type:complete
MIQNSLYLHIPFCKQACHYCDFHFSTNLKTKEGVLAQMHLELESKAALSPWKSTTLKSVYFGGGTPSILASSELKELLNAIKSLFSYAHDMEVTLEANPDDITLDKLNSWHDLGINRLSVGIQSFHETELKACNRAHDSSMAHSALEMINASAFSNFSIDLIYGMIGSSITSWKENLDLAYSYAPSHISCYILAVEKRTVLDKQVRTGEVVLPSDHIALQQFADLREWAKIHNYEHYELSNFSQPGRHSIHNKHYWSYQPYLGIGPGAHSFNGEQRSWNVSNNIRYAKGEAGDHENLSVQEKLNERLMVRLHTSDGFILSRDLDPLGLNPDMTARFTYNIKNALEQGKIIEIPGGFRISASDWIVSDRIISDLFIED